MPEGACPNLLEPFERVAVSTAGEDGQVRFRVDARGFDEPGPIAWQALVFDPEFQNIYTMTEVVVRHVATDVSDAIVTFDMVNREADLDQTATSGNTHTGGVAFVDLNNDLWPDLYISNGADRRNYLYRNNGDGTFTDLSEAVDKPPGSVECAGVKAADIDNDGDIDLLIPVDNKEIMQSSTPQPKEGGPNMIYLNEGNFTFADDPVAQARSAGFADPRGFRNSSAAVADYNLDGCIDVYVTHWAMAAEPGNENFDRLLKGDCAGGFTDVTAEFGVDGKGRDGLVGFWWDADFDRYPELYVGNNSDEDDPPVFEPRDVFYRNRIGEGGGFEEWVDEGIGYDAWAAMGVDIGDIDADGDWDLYITDVWFLEPVPHGNALYMGEPDGGLSENRCHEWGLCFGYNSWPTNFEDFDNDGWIDVWVGSSLPQDPDMVYLNQQTESGRRFVAQRQQDFRGHIARAGTTADYDGDGDIDIFLFDEGGDSSLWRNNYLEPGGDPEDLVGKHWIEFKLRGSRSNRAGIGAVLRTEVDGLKMMRRVTGGDSAHSHRMLLVHFGLGEAAQLDRVEITWPMDDGSVQVLENLAANRVWIIDEDQGVIEHAFAEAVATWQEGQLQVSTASNYGGRAPIEVAGFGPLAYDAETVLYGGTFAVEAAPAEVELTTSYGASLIVPVTQL